MPPTDRFVCRFAAEPPQEGLPYGRWAERLQQEFLTACLAVETDEGEELGEPGEIAWYPDRTWNGRTYVPATTRTSTNLELFGYVSFAPAEEGGEPEDFAAVADYTDEIAEVLVERIEPVARAEEVARQRARPAAVRQPLLRRLGDEAGDEALLDGHVAGQSTTRPASPR